MPEIVEWPLAHGRSIALGARSVVMGVINLTPDSFSDGGMITNAAFAIEKAQHMIGEGAAIIDIGGESTRPGAIAISAEEEQARILPVIEALAAKQEVILSVDTYREETARLAVDAGAHIVNDVWGLQREPGVAKVAAETGAGLVIMHTGRERVKRPDGIDDQLSFLTRSMQIARAAGVDENRIVLDPGFGFAKETTEENLDLMARFGELRQLGRPWLVGTSRKRFIGALTGRNVEARDSATAATSVILRMQGAVIFRVHDVAINVDALRFADAMLDRGLSARRD